MVEILMEAVTVSEKDDCYGIAVKSGSKGVSPGQGYESGSSTTSPVEGAG